MRFLERMDRSKRERLLAAARVVRLARGDYLLRRGERGGDIYLVEEGSLEIVDTRKRPEVVLMVAGPGSVVGEMAFIDEAPRAADVRAALDTVCLFWERSELKRALDGDPDLASEFYRAVSGMVVDRVRSITSDAVVGGIGRGDSDAVSLEVELARTARAIADQTRSAWLEADAGFRRDSSADVSPDEIRTAFDCLVRELDSWMSGIVQHRQKVEAGLLVRRELQPYLLRAKLGALALDGASNHVGEPEFMAHVILNQANGSGQFGRILDAALLDLPTCEAIRRRTTTAAAEVVSALAPDRPVNMLVINAACGALLARTLAGMGHRGGRVTCVDGSREALAFLDAGLPRRSSAVELRLVQEDLARMCMGRSEVHFDPQDVIVVDGLVDHLPDRLVAAVAQWCADHIDTEGTVFFTGLEPSRDGTALTYLLDWPLIRRPAENLLALIRATGLGAEVVVGGANEPDPAVVIRGSCSS